MPSSEEDSVTQSLTEQGKIQRSRLFPPGLRYLEADDQQKAVALWDKSKVLCLIQVPAEKVSEDTTVL